jgi:hypothetical protein
MLEEFEELSGTNSVPPLAINADKPGVDSEASRKLVDLCSSFQTNLMTGIPVLAQLLNTLQYSPVFKSPRSPNNFDMAKMGAQILNLRSSFFSDIFGGNKDDPLGIRLQRLAQLEYICEASPDMRLALELSEPSIDDCIDVQNTLDPCVILGLNRVWRGRIKASASNSNTDGDDSGFLVSELCGLRFDQLWLMQENAATLVASGNNPVYEEANFRARKPYEYAIKALAKAAIHSSSELTRESEAFESLMLEITTQDNVDQSVQSYTRNQTFKNFALYKVLVLGEIMFEFIAIQQEYVTSLTTVCDALEVLGKSILPELGKLVWVAKIPELSDFLTQVENWWKASLYTSVKKNLQNNSESIEVEKFLRVNTARFLMDLAIKPLKNTQKLVRKIQYLQVLCPESRNPEEHTELQLCLANLKSLYSFLLPQMESLKKFVGDVDELDVCKDPKSFLFIYQQFRTQYAEVFGMDFKMDVIKEARDRKREENNVSSALHTTLPVIESPNAMQVVGVKKTSTPAPSPRPSPSSTSSSSDKISPHGGTPGRETLTSSQKVATPRREMLSTSSQKVGTPPTSRGSSVSNPPTGDSAKNSPSASPRVFLASSSGKRNEGTVGSVGSSRRRSSAYEEGRINSSHDQYRGGFFQEAEQPKRTVVLAEQLKQNPRSTAPISGNTGSKGDD